MTLALKMNPIEIPEVLHIVGSLLPTIDVKSCMLVSKTWLALFREYFWHHLVYSSRVIPGYDEHAHLVRRLTTYALGDGDLQKIAGACHWVQHLQLEIGVYPIFQGIDILFAELQQIRQLQFKTCANFDTKYLAPLIAIHRLQSLSLSSSTSCAFGSNAGFNLRALINVLDHSPRLRTLKLEHLEDVEEPNVSMFSFRTRRLPRGVVLPDGSILESGAIDRRNGQRHLSVWSKIAKTVCGTSKESWRKFVVGPPPPPGEPAKIFCYEVDLLKNPDLNVPLEQLTKLVVRKVRVGGDISGSQVSLAHIFQKSPHLDELHVDFWDGIPLAMAKECLEAIGNTCRKLVTLTLENLVSTDETRLSIQDFLHLPRRDLLHLKLTQCHNIGHILEHIPTSVASLLKDLILDNCFVEHLHVHHMLMRCSSLEYFSWNDYGDSSMRQPRLDMLVEPWACMGTLRYFEHRTSCNDQDTLDALSARIGQMPRLISLGTCVPQGLLSFAKVAPEKESAKKKRQEEEVDGNGEHRMDTDPSKLTCSKKVKQDTESEKTTAKEEEELVYSTSVQELTVSAISPATSLHWTRSVFLLPEFQRILESFPNLRKIRYRGATFPLGDDTYRWLKARKLDISVLHVSQLPRVSVFDE
ncbi:hypothetical protein BG004_004571 [Podila humilis]|nr:hypothetical protein BG004_004571 [Podila humilis]